MGLRRVGGFGFGVKRFGLRDQVSGLGSRAEAYKIMNQAGHF